MLELERVSRRYEGPAELVTAVDDVSLAVAPAEVVAIVGPSGSGKTTLLLLAAGIVAPDAGSVRFDGHDLSAMSERDAAGYRLRTLGFVFQEPNLMPMTAVENVALPLIAAGADVRSAVREAWPLVEQVGLAHRGEHRPHELSGGERQRVAVARALVARPRLVLADEPTGSLDSRRGEQILDVLHEAAAARGTAVVVVTHDLRAAARANRVCEMEDGRLTEVRLDEAERAASPGALPVRPG